MRWLRCGLLISLASLLLPAAGNPAASKYLVYIGTYTGPDSKGIYVYRFDTATGKVDSLGLAGEMIRPSFLALHPNQRFLYAVSELGNDGRVNGSITAFAIDRKSGVLTPLNTVSSGGGGSCHLVVDRTGRSLVVADYGSGRVASLQVNPDGRLSGPVSVMQHSGSSVDPKRQTGPHAHAVVLSPDNRFVLVPDLGLDQIRIYRLDPATATLTPADPPFVAAKAGSGPRHLVFSPDGRFAYSLHEMGSLVTVWAYTAVSGHLAEVQTISTLPARTPRRKLRWTPKADSSTLPIAVTTALPSSQLIRATAGSRWWSTIRREAALRVTLPSIRPGAICLRPTRTPITSSSSP